MASATANPILHASGSFPQLTRVPATQRGIRDGHCLSFCPGLPTAGASKAHGPSSSAWGCDRHGCVACLPSRSDAHRLGRRLAGEKLWLADRRRGTGPVCRSSSSGPAGTRLRRASRAAGTRARELTLQGKDLQPLCHLCARQHGEAAHGPDRRAPGSKRWCCCGVRVARDRTEVRLRQSNQRFRCPRHVRG
jgi:hypothetical protein